MRDSILGMADIALHGPLREMTGGHVHRVAAATVLDAITVLESDHPALTGWILDERRCVRRHISVFVNGLRVDVSTSLGPDDRVEILPAITGG